MTRRKKNLEMERPVEDHAVEEWWQSKQAGKIGIERKSSFQMWPAGGMQLRKREAFKMTQVSGIDVKEDGDATHQIRSCWENSLWVDNVESWLDRCLKCLQAIRWGCLQAGNSTSTFLHFYSCCLFLRPSGWLAFSWTRCILSCPSIPLFIPRIYTFTLIQIFQGPIQGDFLCCYSWHQLMWQFNFSSLLKAKFFWTSLTIFSFFNFKGFIRESTEKERVRNQGR